MAIGIGISASMHVLCFLCWFLSPECLLWRYRLDFVISNPACDVLLTPFSISHARISVCIYWHIFPSIFATQHISQQSPHLIPFHRYYHSKHNLDRNPTEVRPTAKMTKSHHCGGPKTGMKGNCRMHKGICKTHQVTCDKIRPKGKVCGAKHLKTEICPVCKC